jgi:quercetin dioxygenase-like cupin family protein
MTDEELFRQGTTAVRRLVLNPGEAMAWHRDPHQRVAVVLQGDVLEIEFRDSDDKLRVEIHPGQTEWEEPSQRVHRAINVGQKPYEQITIYLLDRPDAVPQPHEE